jgi:hypothetical protein
MSRKLTTAAVIEALRKAGRHDKTAVLDAIEAAKSYIYDKGHNARLVERFAGHTDPLPHQGEFIVLVNALRAWAHRHAPAVGPLPALQNLLTLDQGTGPATSGFIAPRPFDGEAWFAAACPADGELNDLRRLVEGLSAGPIPTEWDNAHFHNLQALPKTLLHYMCDRDSAELDELAEHVWGSSEVSEGAIHTAVGRANDFLTSIKARHFLHKAGTSICWK